MLKELKIELTNRCSRNCIHCSSSATSNAKNIKELEYEDVKKIILEAKQMNVTDVVFTGGEPLKYEKINDLIKLTKELEINSAIYTFDYRNDENINKYKKLIDSGLNKIIYSLADSLSNQKDSSTYTHIEFFDKLLKNSNCKLGFHYTISKDSISQMQTIVNATMEEFHNRKYFEKISLLRFVPHGKGSKNMDLTREELNQIKDFYLESKYKDKIRLGSPWNLLNIKNSPCIIADEIMIIGFDGIAYPCDSIKYFTKLGISGNIKENTLKEMYNSEYFKLLRELNTENSCKSCKDYKICKSGCIGQKIIAGYNKNEDIYTNLKKCINSKDPKCMKTN